MDCSRCLEYMPLSTSSRWYCGLAQVRSTSTLSIVQGYEKDTLDLLSKVVVKMKSCGKHRGKTHQMPSVSSSSVLPMPSTSARASLMMAAPV